MDERAELERGLARLWPHREHESNWFFALLCACGLHRWAELDLSGLYAESRVRFCRKCPRIEMIPPAKADTRPGECSKLPPVD